MENTYKNYPELCKKFVDASIEGWEYALAHKDETIETVDKYKELTKVSYNKSHSVWMLNSMEDMIGSSGKSVKKGNLLESDYDYLTNFLLDNKFITSKPGYEEFYKGSW
jgi:NitT/TauT family transport system substrate-binding protein